MPNSLLTGVSGLLAHQRLLDIVGHNIANMNTTAFKGQRILFADLLYETIRPATSSGDGNQGGTNPNQIGSGVKAAITDRNFSQGALESTGGDFDFALTGPGFFTLSGPNGDLYTRAGAFSLDEQGYLVAPGGLHVKRFTSAGEPDGVNPGFQVQGDQRIRVPLGAPVEGVITSSINVTGNLNAKTGPAVAQLIQTNAPLEVGGAVATGATLLNSLDSVAVPYADGDVIYIEGMQHDGAAQVFSPFTVTSTSTVQDLIDAIDAEFPSSTAQLIQGNIVLESDIAGESAMAFSLRNDSTNNVGDGIDFGQHQLLTEVEGENAGTGAAIVTVYDVQGGPHELTLKFEKQTDDIWEMKAILDPDEGILIDDTIENIAFNDSGLLVSSATPSITMQINGIAIPHTITFDFGDPTSSTRLSHFNATSSLTASADGSAPGELTNVQVESNGEIKGVASNGKVFTLAQLAITSFSNTKGLVGQGDNLYKQSLNSGQPDVGEAGSGGRGVIQGGQLESSNVDVASEFTKLIVAQRGFSANARTITISSEVLEELTNIIR